jgi:hypothetical protein
MDLEPLGTALIERYLDSRGLQFFRGHDSEDFLVLMSSDYYRLARSLGGERAPARCVGDPGGWVRSSLCDSLTTIRAAGRGFILASRAWAGLLRRGPHREESAVQQTAAPTGEHTLAASIAAPAPTARPPIGMAASTTQIRAAEHPSVCGDRPAMGDAKIRERQEFS